jgi:acetyltransferase
MMQRLIDYARKRGLGDVHGDVLAENHRMLEFCDALGFKRTPIAGDATVVRVTLALR